MKNFPAARAYRLGNPIRKRFKYQKQNSAARAYRLGNPRRKRLICLKKSIDMFKIYMLKIYNIIYNDQI